MRKNKLLKVKLSESNLRIYSFDWLVFGISWRMPLRVIVMAKILKYTWIPKSALNFCFNLGAIIEYDAKGIQIYLETFGRGFNYLKYKDCDDKRIRIERFRWIK